MLANSGSRARIYSWELQYSAGSSGRKTSAFPSCTEIDLSHAVLRESGLVGARKGCCDVRSIAWCGTGRPFKVPLESWSFTFGLLGSKKIPKLNPEIQSWLFEKSWPKKKKQHLFFFYPDARQKFKSPLPKPYGIDSLVLAMQCQVTFFSRDVTVSSTSKSSKGDN